MLGGTHSSRSCVKASISFVNPRKPLDRINFQNSWNYIMNYGFGILGRAPERISLIRNFLMENYGFRGIPPGANNKNIIFNVFHYGIELRILDSGLKQSLK